MKRLPVAAGLSALLVLTAGVVARWSRIAHAQPRGQLILTQTAPPAQVSPQQIYRFMRKHRVHNLRQLAGEKFWRVHLFAHLRMAPPRSLLNLPLNRGRVHLAYYRWVRRRWVRDNVDDVSIKPGVRFLQTAYRIDSSLGLAKGARYQLRVTLLNRRKREVVLATGHFTLR